MYKVLYKAYILPCTNRQFRMIHEIDIFNLLSLHISQRTDLKSVQKRVMKSINTPIHLFDVARSRHFTEARPKIPTSCTPKVVKTTCLKPKKVPYKAIMKKELAGSHIIALNIVASSSRLVHRSFKRESKTLPKILSWSFEGIDSLSSTSPKLRRKECWKQ